MALTAGNKKYALILHENMSKNDSKVTKLFEHPSYMAYEKQESPSRSFT